jgi:hypothetical protein
MLQMGKKMTFHDCINVRFAELDAVLGALGWVGIRDGHVLAAVEEAGHFPE